MTLQIDGGTVMSWPAGSVGPIMLEGNCVVVYEDVDVTEKEWVVVYAYCLKPGQYLKRTAPDTYVII